MLSGLGSLLFGTGGASGERDNAAVDQTPGGQPTPLDTQDADNGWVLVDRADNEGRAEGAPHHPEDKEPVNHHPEPAGPERETEQQGNEEMEHQQQPEEDQPMAEQHQRNARRAARAMRATALEVKQVELIRSVQRKQHLGKTKQLNRRCLEVRNKAHSVRKPASAHCRVLRPSGQMNGRQSQRPH
eukprot:TRINITY_DN178854_c0_g1_i1.p1 TRINITY_DN178854_c0_g1~~TRINITY_DN178854_c0_g1_i1.p1  ORF type:complete len:186 (+),score=40.12 TRINITY_DN178854_c0_g1_i1:17-574(+)